MPVIKSTIALVSDLVNKHKQDEYKSYDDIIKTCCTFGVDVTWRKLNYYKSLSLLPKAERVEGDKKGYYPRYITLTLLVYSFLQNHLGLTLKDIKKELERVKHFTADNRIFMFAIWVDVSYRYFLDIAIEARNKTIGSFGTGVSDISILNSLYKQALLQTGIPLKGGDDIFAKTKEWVEAIVKTYQKNGALYIKLEK